MAERKYRQIDSPWIDMSHLDWGPLTDERYARHFFRGHIFYGQQEYSENVFIIKRGRVAMCLCTPEGDMRNTMVLDAGCMFGNQTLFDGSPNSCQAEVVSDEADVYVIPKEEASSRIRDNFQMTHNILMQSNRINRMLLTQIELMSFHHSEGRVCFYLLHLAEQYSEEKNGQKLLYIRFTHQDIAEITGLSRVCVSNIISGLVKDRILMKKSGLYYVVQMLSLIHISEPTRH